MFADALENKANQGMATIINEAKSYDRDPDGRLSTTFTRWALTRDQVLDLLESAAEKNSKCETMFLDIKCQKDWRSSQGVGGSYSWEFFCNKAQLGPTEFLGHILREWENLKVREAKVEMLNGVVGVAASTVKYANEEAKNSADRQTVMKVVGLLKDGNDVNVQVNTQVNTLAAMNVPSADEGILKRFDFLKDVQS